MPINPRLLLPLILLALAGCAHPTPDNAALTAGALPSQAPAKFAAGAPDETAVVSGWLATFGDAQLEKLVDEALKGNRDLAAMSARLDQAASRARQAGADLKPQVSLAANADSKGGANAPRTDKMGAGLSLSWEFDLWGRLSAGQAAAREQYASTAADLEFARQSLAAQVAKGWFLAIQAVQQEAIVTQAAALQKRNAELVAERQRVGRNTLLDVAQARSAAATAEDAVHQAASGRENAARSLELLLGRYPSAELTLAATLPALPPMPPAGLPSQLLERRPDLIAATRRVAVAFNQVESAKAARLPRLAITANAGTVSQEFRSLSLNDAFWNLGANLVGPIYSGGRLKEQVVIETAKQQEALALYGKAALEAFRQVEQALAESRRLATRLELLTAAEQDQNEAERLTQVRLEAGAIDQLAVILIQERALQARLARLALQVEGLTNRVNLHLSLGGGFEAPPPAPDDLAPASKAVPAGNSPL
jgi:NodT family efflux transporter outer membrane factor (OMF) lipoprotein